MKPVPLITSDPGRCLPPLSPAEREAAGQLLYELSVQRLEVGLSEASDSRHRGHMVRTVFNRNPTWYQKLCNKSTKKRSAATLKRRGHRKHDTDIRRCFVERFIVLPVVRAAAKC